MKYPTLYFKNNTLFILDQTKLPQGIKFIPCTKYQQVRDAIMKMKIRGAPAIGVASAYGVALGALCSLTKNIFELKKEINKIAEEFIKTRPTAVNIKWAVEKMIDGLRIADCGLGIDDLKKILVTEAKKIHKEDIETNKKIGKSGADLISDGDVILTHCNAGSLATGGWGTALGVLFAAAKQGKKITVFVDETRPYLQGARLTCFELKNMKIFHYLICDNMAGYFIKKGEINKVITGADRIVKNGDAANKIGTYTLAVLAKENKIPFYIAAPLSSFDKNIPSGDGITIEERNKNEVLYINKKLIASYNTFVKNPAFDITPSKYITAIITEKGIIKKPYTKNIAEILKN